MGEGDRSERRLIIFNVEEGGLLIDFKVGKEVILGLRVVYWTELRGWCVDRPA